MNRKLFPGQGAYATATWILVVGLATRPAVAWDILSAETRGHSHGVTVVFSNPVDSRTAIRPEHYTITPGVDVTNVVGLSSTTVRLFTTRIAEGEVYTLSVTGVVDRGDATAKPSAGATTRFLQTQGGIVLEEYRGIEGWQLSDLSRHPGFPANPDVASWATRFESPVDLGDHYGMRFRGYVTAPESGEYRFHLVSDDQGSLELSPTENPAERRRIALEPEWGGLREWVASANQNSRVPLPDVEGAFVIEGEDFDHDGGAFRPEAGIMPYRGGAYAGMQGIPEIDYHDGGGQESVGYRPTMAGVVLEPSADRSRGSTGVEADFVVAANRAGDWYNYSRVVPPREYFVLARLCGVGLPMRAVLDEVVAGVGTRDQRLVRLGRFDAPFTGGWDRFVLVPLRDERGALARIVGDGRRTFRFTVEPGSLNLNYLVLLPVERVSPGLEFLRPRNISEPIRLEAGRKYYVEALGKEGEGGDHLAVAWRMPGQPELSNGADPIPGRYLSGIDPLEPVVVVEQPRNVTVEELGSADFEVRTTGSPETGYQWYRNGVAIEGADGARLRWEPVGASDDGAVFHVVVWNGVGLVRSSEAVLGVVVDRIPPAVESVYGGSRSVTVKFSETVDPGSATQASRYRLDGGVVVELARLRRDGRTVVLSTSEMSGRARYRLTVQGVRDISPAGNGGEASLDLSFVAHAQEAGIDAAGMTAGQAYGADTLGEDWFNAAGEVRENSYWTTHPSRYLVADSAQSYTLRGKGVSRDHELETWARVFTASLRTTPEGRGIVFEYSGESPSGHFSVHIVDRSREGAFGEERRYTLFETSDLAAMVPEYHAAGTEEDRFTLGVEGFDIYARYNGHEFLRFREYRHMEEGQVALRAPPGYGLRFASVRHLPDAARLVSDYENGVLDLRDFGLRSILATGSIVADQRDLVLTEVPSVPFEAGDHVIVEIGGEVGLGRRGTRGVGGSWPSRSFPTVEVLQERRDFEVGTYAWTEDSGEVYRWSGDHWLPSEAGTYYYRKAIPLALKARIANIGDGGRRLVLDRPARTTATRARVHLDNAFVLAKLGRQADGDGENNWPIVRRSGPGAPESNFEAITPSGIRLVLPEGAFAMGELVRIAGHHGWKIQGAGRDRTLLFSPKGAPTASLGVEESAGVEITDLELRGNLGDDGFCPRIGYLIPTGDPVTDTSIPQASVPNGIGFLRCSQGSVRDVMVTDPWVRAVESAYSTNVWAERVHVRRTQFLREYFSSWLFQFGDSVGGGARDCSVFSPKLNPGMQSFKSQGTRFLGCALTNAYVACNAAGNVLIRHVNLVVEPGVAHPAARGGDMIQIVANVGSPYGYEVAPVDLEEIRLTQSGYLDDGHGTVGGIGIASKNRQVNVRGFEYSGPGHFAGTEARGSEALRSDSTETFVEAERVLVQGSARPFYGNIRIAAGVLRDCVADRLVVGGRASVASLAPGYVAGMEWSDGEDPGDTLATLRSNPAFPDRPEWVEYVRRFEVGAEDRGFYGESVVAWVVPPVSGPYTFYLSADRQAELFLSTDDRREHSRRIAADLAGNGSREWIQGRNQSARGVPPSNVSSPVVLEAGRPYFVEVQMKGYYGGTGHAEIAWRKPGDPEMTNGAPSIGELYLTARPAVGSIEIYGPPTSQGVAEGSPVEVSVGVRGAPPYGFQWFENGLPLQGETRSTLRIPRAVRELHGSEYRVSVSNLLGGAMSEPFLLRVNSAPVLASVEDVVVREGDEWFGTATATDADSGAIVRFELEAPKAEGLSIDPADGTMRWHPTETQGPGRYPVTIRVTDDGDPPMTATRAFVITVEEVNSAPSIEVPDLVVGSVGESIHLVLGGSDLGDLPPNALTFSASDLPEGATLNAGTGAFEWRPAAWQVGEFRVGFQVGDDGVPPRNAEAVVLLRVEEPRVLAIREVKLLDGAITIRWESESGGVYRVEVAEALSSNPWSVAAEVVAAGDASEYRTAISDSGARFFRVVRRR